MSEQETQRTLPAEGRWRGKVVEHDMGEAGTGNPQIAIGFEYLDGEGKTQRITYFGVFTEKTVQSEYGPLYALKNLGYDLDEKGFSDEAFQGLGAKTAKNPSGGQLVGREADITVEHEIAKEGKQKGNRVARVAWVNAPGGGLGMKNRCEDATAITSIAGRIRALAGGGPAPSVAPSSRAAPAGAKGNALPF